MRARGLRLQAMLFALIRSRLALLIDALPAGVWRAEALDERFVGREAADRLQCRVAMDA